MLTSPINVEVDSSADCAYVRLSNEPVSRTVEATSQVLVDLDVMNVVVGIELLAVDARLPFDDLVTKFHVRSEVVNKLRQVVSGGLPRPIVSGGSEGTSVLGSRRRDMVATLC